MSIKYATRVILYCAPDYIFIRRVKVVFRAVHFAEQSLQKGKRARAGYVRLFRERTLIMAACLVYETYAERSRRGTGGSRRARLIYSGRELMYSPLLDVVGAFHSAASRRDKRYPRL